jgi:hypothetical protein
MSSEWRIAKLLNMLQNGTHRGKEARQTSQYMEGWDKGQHAQKETLRMKNISIVSSEGRQFCL